LLLEQAVCIFLVIFFLLLFYEFVQHKSALQAGARLLPFIFTSIFFSILNVGIMSTIGVYWPRYIIGFALCVIGGSLLYTTEVHTSFSHLTGYSVLLSTGSGMFTQASYAVAQAKVLPEEASLSTGCIICGQMTGSTISVAIANTLFTNRSVRNIMRELPQASHESISATVAGANPKFFMALTTAQEERVYEIITDAINQAYILVMAAGALAFVLSLFMKRERLFLQAGAIGA
jgi:hypothetical protein